LTIITHSPHVSARSAMLVRRYSTQIAARATVLFIPIGSCLRPCPPNWVDVTTASRAGGVSASTLGLHRCYSNVTDLAQITTAGATSPSPLYDHLSPLPDKTSPTSRIIPADLPLPGQDSDPSPDLSRETHASSAHNIVDLQKSLSRLRSALLRQDRAQALIIAAKYTRTVALTSPPESAVRQYDRLFDVFLSDEIVDLPSTTPTLCDILQSPENTPVCSDIVSGKLASLAIKDRRYLTVLSVLFRRDPPDGDHQVFSWIAQGLFDRLSDPSILIKMVFEYHADATQGAALRDPLIWRRLIQACKRKPATRRDLIELFRRVCESHKIREDDDSAEARERANQLALPFTAFLAQWAKDYMAYPSRRQSQDGTSFPRQVATELSEVIGWTRLPAHFLNEWMRAETATSNHDVAEMVWKTFYTAYTKDKRAAADAQDRLNQIRLTGDTAEIDLAIAEASVRHRIVEENSDRPVPDGTTYRLYFKLYKSLYNPEPIRTTISSMLDNIPREGVDCNLLNTLLSAVLSKVHTDDLDLPLFYLVLSMYDPNPFDRGTTWGPPLDRRTVNIAAGGIAQLWRRTGAVLDPLWDPNVAATVRRRTAEWREGKEGLPSGPLHTGLHPDEWRMISSALDEIVPLPASTADKSIYASPLPRVHLPLGTKGFIRAQDPARITQRSPDRPFLASRPDEPVPPAPDMPQTWQEVYNANWNQHGLAQAEDPATGEILRALRVLLRRAIRLVLADTMIPSLGNNQEMLDKALVKNLQKVWDETGFTGPGRPALGADLTCGDLGLGNMEEAGGEVGGQRSRLAPSDPESDGRVRARLNGGRRRVLGY
jgi:hypothetical protein